MDEDMEVRMEQYRQRQEQREREELARFQAEGLMEQWDKLKAAERTVFDAQKQEETERQTYTDMLANALNVRPGIRVSVTKAHGYGSSKATRTTVYEVVNYQLYGATQLRLFGKTVLKNGAVGEALHEIYGKWQRVEAQ